MPMTTYHPPMTGLESHIEEELAHEAHKTEEALKQAKALRGKPRKTASSRQRESEMDRKTEDAMHLDA